jgi:hypothetical protein
MRPDAHVADFDHGSIAEPIQLSTDLDGGRTVMMLVIFNGPLALQFCIHLKSR